MERGAEIMMGYLILFYEFFKIGLFSVGGGLATLPFLYRLADKYNWFNHQMIGDMIAISESTPGPLGVNMATYTGFQNSGMLGSIVATIGLVLPSVVIIILISKVLDRFRTNEKVEQIFYALRPVVTGMIGAACFTILIGALFPRGIGESGIFASLGLKEMVLFIVMLFATKKWERHPIFYIIIGAICGIVFQF